MNSQWLNALFNTNPDKTKKSLADFLNMEPPAISKMLNGTRQIKAEEYVAMRAFFGMPNDGDHAINAGMQPALLSSEASNHSFMEPTRENEPWNQDLNINEDNSNIIHRATMVVENIDDFMTPDFDVDDKILVDLDDRNIKVAGIFVVSDTIRYLIRQCEAVTNEAAVQIQVSATKEGFLPQILELDELQIIGRVIGKIQIG